MTLVANTREEMGKCTEVKVGRVKQLDCKSVGLCAVLACKVGFFFFKHKHQAFINIKFLICELCTLNCQM